ncbi:type VI secretion system tube protein Hcp [Hylemonella sp. W303a]|uniref:type VI secretion system tube protein Hcp n=1 Tax=Hylemonella sp. W303a TaxID=3389873 RepID=UPI00396B1BD0
MDLIILQPGDDKMLSTNSWTTGGSLLDPSNSVKPGNVWPGPPDPVFAGGANIGVALRPGGYIELVSVHQGMKQQMTTDVSNSARTSGRPVITEFTCVKYVDKSSVLLFDRCLRALPLGAGAAAPTMLYVLRNSGTTTANIITMALRDAMISEIQFQTNPNDMPTEQFKINFTEILWTYTVQNADTTAGGVMSSGWSLARNAPIGQFT